MVCAVTGAWADDLSGGGSYTVADGVVTFSGTTVGAISGESSFNFNGATRIKFDNTCAINKQDLERFLQGNTYYVDLFDITNGENTPMKIDDYTTTADDNDDNNIDKIIEAAVADMVTNGWQAKGIILPLNSGSGTSKVEMANNGGLPTFSEYAAYYRSTQEIATIHVYDMNTFYSKEAPLVQNGSGAQPNFETAADHLLSHQEVSNSDIFMVSTNNVNRIDVSKLPSDKTQIVIAGDEMVKEANKGLADIYVKTVEPDDFKTAVASTGIKNTPCQLLSVEGPVSGDDVKAVNLFNSETVAGPSIYRLDGATEATADMLLAISNKKIEYIMAPKYMTGADDIQVLSGINTQNNSSLKVVGAYNGDHTSFNDEDEKWGELAMHSFEANSVLDFMSTLNIPTSSPILLSIRMSGEYGDKDLVNGTSLNFGNTPALWDFTGASFTPCAVDATVCNRGPYYASSDPFCDYSTVTLTSNYQSNSFYYFSYYSTKVVDIKLPTGITELPPACMTRLGEENASNYKRLYNKTAEEYAAIEAELTATMQAMNKQYTGDYYPIDQLVIPDNIVTIGYECCVQSVIRSVLLGKGVTDVQGGAFKLNYFLENLDCKAGISECRLGDQAFNECDNMKHIVLSEGIISLGANCFNNSQHLESIRLPETLKAIGNYCFMNGHALSSITIPATVRKIGMGAFTLTALTDIYLMAEDPADVPIIYTAGSDWGDDKSTFSKNTMESNNTLNWNGEGNFNGKTSKKVNEMTFDEAAAAYFAYCNRMAALHFSPNVADVVLAEISSYYGCTSTDGYGIPIMQTDDSGKRGNAMGLQDMGSSGQGIYTKYGWAQFLIQKEFTPDHPEVFTKEYDDVWYTMCFPFDLTDEQLATAFNEGFNIVDFSGVEIQENQSDEGKKLILHFNKVAKTIYKDAEGNVYAVIGREPDGKFDYNVYQRDGKTYRHVSVGSGGTGYKTKTFAENGDANNGVIEIDGILASAGHPYMVHPNTGTNSGMPLTRCHFSGITWKAPDTWETIFNNEKRVVDLTVARGNMETGEPDGDNYLQAAYNYNGTYTFIGNPKALKDGAPAEPTDQYQSYPTYPTLASYPTEPSLTRPEEPTAPTDPTNTVGARMSEEDKPTAPTNPADDTTTYPTAFQTLYNTVRCENVYLGYIDGANRYGDVTYGEDLANGNFGEFIWGQPGQYSYATNANLHSYTSCVNVDVLKAYLGDPIDQDRIEEYFNSLKSLVTQYATAMASYQSDLATYNTQHDAWAANRAAWAQYDADCAQFQADHEAWENWTAAGAQEAHDQWVQDCEDIDDANAELVSQYNTDYANVYRYNKDIKDAWEASLAAYKKLIPKGAYFLGRRGRGWPKYFREIADENRENPTGGFWTQYTAIIVPNEAALEGIEKELDGTTAMSKGFEMKFDESFEGDVIDQENIQTIIEDARKEGVEPVVEYMDVVVNINGQIVRSGSTSIEGLPKGVYIVNGKKYFVK